MKKITIIYLSAFFLIVFSCNKKLDIAPSDTIVERDVFKTEAGAEQALTEAYYNFMETITNYFAYTFGDYTTPILDVSINNMTYVLGETTPDDYFVANTWEAYFKTINTANNVIQKIPVYGTFSEQKQQQFIAEAKFIRAYCYLNLLCLYGDGALSGNMDGLGLPLQLTPFEGYNTGEIIPRSTNGEVYSQIIKDLAESLSALPVKQANELKTRSRATQGGANALLARAYLYMGDYDESAKAAQKVLDLEPSVYDLTDDLLDLFPLNSAGTPQNFTKEYIFGLPISQMQSSYTSANNGIANSYFYKRSVWISDDFINEFEAGDLRVSQLMWKGDSIYNPDMFDELTSFKFNNSFGRDNVPMIRLAEVILTRAEALARSNGINQESIDLLNQIRNRSVPGATSYFISDFGSAEDLVQKILLQRKFELAFEGLHRYDLIRTGKPLHTPDIPENKKVLPIPKIEVDISNNLIKQNSGY